MSDSTKTLLLAVVVLLALCAGWFMVHYRPNLIKVQALQQKKEELMDQIRGFRISAAELDALEQQVKMQRQSLKTTRARLVQKDELGQAVEQIRNGGKRHGLQFQQIIPDYASLMTIGSLSDAATEVQKLTVHLNMRGGYKNFGRFLESLSKLPFLVSLGDVSVVYHKGAQPELELVADAQLFVTGKQERQH